MPVVRTPVNKAAVIGCVAADPSAVAFLKIEHRRLLQGRRFIIRGRRPIPASFLPTESDFGEQDWQRPVFMGSRFRGNDKKGA